MNPIKHLYIHTLTLLLLVGAYPLSAQANSPLMTGVAGPAKKQGYQILVNIAVLKIPYPQLVVETTERYARENPQTVKSFLKGFIEGVHYAANQKNETKKIMTKYLKTVDPEILDIAYQNFLETTDYSGRPNLDGIRNAMDEVAARVPAVKSRKPEEFVDTRILRELEKEGFFKQFQKKS